MSELHEFSEELAEKPVVVAANKMDLPDSRELFPEFKDELEKRGVKVFAVSGATREGVDELLKYLCQQLQELREPVQIAANEDEKLYEYLEAYQIEMVSEGQWLVTGPEIERMVAMTDFTSDEAIAIFRRKLKKLGFIDDLAQLEAGDDDVFSIGEMEFAYREFFI